MAKVIQGSSRLMVFHSGSWEGQEFHFYCPFLRVGQSVWVEGYYGGDWKAQFLCSYSSDLKGLIQTNQGGRSRWLCFRPFIQAVMWSGV